MCIIICYPSTMFAGCTPRASPTPAADNFQNGAPRAPSTLWTSTASALRCCPCPRPVCTSATSPWQGPGPAGSNEAAAECVKDHPNRFGLFATLTLPDVDGALQAASYAFDELSADGIVLLANSRGNYLGNPGFDPLMAELDRRGAIVFVHPTELPGPAAPGIPPFAADFLLDTTRAAFHLVRNDVPSRYPDIKFILAHAGGFVPYAAHRLALTIAEATRRDLPQVLDAFRSFYFDTACPPAQ
jgi:predicted TIM-barrel fold metal-dependent hydrolase